MNASANMLTREASNVLRARGQLNLLDKLTNWLAGWLAGWHSAPFGAFISARSSSSHAKPTGANDSPECARARPPPSR